MSNYISITRIAQMAYGVCAKTVGIPMSVYRLTPTSSGNWIQPENFLFQLYVDRQPAKPSNKGFESAKRMETFWYEIMANCTQLQLGDILVSADQVLNKGSVVVPYFSTEFIGLCLAENMPTRAPIAARINTTAQLYTPNILPTSQNYMDSTLPNRQPIILVNGKFTASNAGQQAAIVPIGFMPFRSGGQIYNQPTANITELERRVLYLPPMPGYQPVAGDEFLVADGSRYIMDSNYHQDAGTVGNQFICHKIASGGGQ